MTKTRQISLTDWLDEIDAEVNSATKNEHWLALALLVTPLVKALRITSDAIAKTLHDQRHLADGENCTLIELKRAQRSLSEHLNVTVAASGNPENSSPASDPEPASSSR